MDKFLEYLVRSAEQSGGLSLWLLFIMLAAAFVFYILMKRGVLTIGKPVGRRRCDKYCDDHRAMKASIESESATTDSDLAEIKTSISELGDRMDVRLEDIYNLMRDYSEKMNKHIGFCEGVQATKKQI